MARNTPLLIVALVFFSLTLYLLLSAPDEDLAASGAASSDSIESPQGMHPCPYADILGLDENSVNPHGADGKLPPLPGATPVVDASKLAAARDVKEAPPVVAIPQSTKEEL